MKPINCGGLETAMNILFCKWTNSCEYGIERTFQSMGHSVTSITHSFENVSLSVESLHILQTTLENNRFDFLFSTNYLPVVSKVCNIYHIPYICWVMDSPCITLYSDSIQNSCNHIFIFDYALYESVVSYNPTGIHYFPLATCTDLWDKISLLEKDHEQYDCDVSFVGSLYCQSSPYKSVEGLSAYTRGYLDGLIDAQLHVYGYHFLQDCLAPEIVQEFKTCADWLWYPDYRTEDTSIIESCYLSKRCAELERCQIAERLASTFDFHLYTNSDVSELQGVQNLGTVDYYDTMPRIFRCSRINLNITSKSIHTGLPLRIFDVLGAGGFLLTNYQEELPNYFEIGIDLDIYESIDDLQDKISYYLEHPELRQEIAKNGQEKVRQNFQYTTALSQILSISLES